MKTMTRLALALVFLLLWVLAGHAAPGPGVLVEGSIMAVDADGLLLTPSGGGPTRVILNAETTIIRRGAVRLEDIRPHDFVGVTARRHDDGTLTAVSITIFPPEFRGRIREAQFVMGTGSIMTNATVFQSVRRADGRTLYLRLPDGAAVITVPREAEVFRLTLMRPADLRPGMRVVVRGTAGADGRIIAVTVTVPVP